MVKCKEVDQQKMGKIAGDLTSHTHTKNVTYNRPLLPIGTGTRVLVQKCVFAKFVKKQMFCAFDWGLQPNKETT